MYGALEAVRKYFDATVEKRAYWKGRNGYYYRKITGYYRFIVPEGSSVLEIGSGDGDLLWALKPSRGLGIDASPRAAAAAAQKHPGLEFREGCAENFRLEPQEKFDYIILSDLIGHLDDVQKVFENLRQAVKPSTRIVINSYNFLWAPAMELASLLGFRMKEKMQNWLSVSDIENLLNITGFQPVQRMTKMILPVKLPLLSGAANRVLANLPLLRHFCLTQFIIARPKPEVLDAGRRVSIVVPCKNEKGNIAELVERIPEFPAGLEVIFIDGRSSDGTADEVRRVAALHPEKNVRLMEQNGTGKGAAVREAFAAASGDVLMILDADISVAPEDTRKFYDLVVSGLGECVNGTRMVYPMEKQAMRFLNILGNKFFSIAFTYLLDQRIKDTLCGTKALSRADYEKIVRNRAFFGDFDPFGDFDILFGAAKMNLKIIELPVRYYERHYGTTKISRFRHGFLLLRMCFLAMRKIKFI